MLVWGGHVDFLRTGRRHREASRRAKIYVGRVRASAPQAPQTHHVGLCRRLVLPVQCACTCPWLRRGGQGALQRLMGRPPHTPTPWAREAPPPPAPVRPHRHRAPRGARARPLRAWPGNSRPGAAHPPGRHVDFSHPQVSRERPTHSCENLRGACACQCPPRTRARGNDHGQKSSTFGNFELI